MSDPADARELLRRGMFATPLPRREPTMTPLVHSDLTDAVAAALRLADGCQARIDAEYVCPVLEDLRPGAPKGVEDFCCELDKVRAALGYCADWLYARRPATDPPAPQPPR